MLTIIAGVLIGLFIFYCLFAWVFMLGACAAIDDIPAIFVWTAPLYLVFHMGMTWADQLQNEVLNLKEEDDEYPTAFSNETD